MKKLNGSFFGSIKPTDRDNAIVRIICERYECNATNLHKNQEALTNAKLRSWLNDNGRGHLLRVTGTDPEGNLESDSVSHTCSSAQIRKRAPGKLFETDGTISPAVIADLTNAILIMFGMAPVPYAISSGLIDVLYPETGLSMGGFTQSVTAKENVAIARNMAVNSKILLTSIYEGDVFYGRSTGLSDCNMAMYAPEALHEKCKIFLQKSADLFTTDTILNQLSGGVVPRGRDIFEATVAEADRWTKSWTKKDKSDPAIFPWQERLFDVCREAKILPFDQPSTLTSIKGWFSHSKAFMTDGHLVEYGGQTRNLGGPGLLNYYEGKIVLPIDDRMTKHISDLMIEGQSSARFLNGGNLSLDRIPENKDDFEEYLPQLWPVGQRSKKINDS